MELIGSIVNQATLQGEINNANGYLTGVITNAGYLGGQVVAERGLQGIQGEQGETGETGATGNGISAITKTSTSGLVDTYTISFTSGSPTTFTVTNGKDGTNGTDGHTPVMTASKAGSTTTIYADGSSIATINDGTNGTNGQDGHTPVMTTTKSGGTTTIKADGTDIGTVLDGDDYVLTSQDKQDIADIVLQDFPIWNGGNY